MALPFVFPQYSQLPLDQNNRFSRSWYLYFQAVFERIGGATGTGNAVLDAVISDIRTELAFASDHGAALATLQRGFVAYQAAQAAVDAAQTAAIVALAARVENLEVLGAFA